MVQDQTLTRRIREQAVRLGFFKVGFARAGPLPAAERFDAWLAAGLHGEMAYIARQAQRRKDPGLLLQNARSFVVLAMNYHTAGNMPADPLYGRISRYAWGDDYHPVVLGRLRQLLDFIRRERPGVEGRCYVDTGPVMEKTWGAETALGWIGKHSNLITREQGSWLFLGVILLDVDLAAESPERNYCGSCSRCISACPTGAIVAPHVVDARLCIAYLTIELRGPIPRRLRRLVGNRIFGCDDCQEVCPWNRFSPRSCVEPFQPRPGNTTSDLVSLSCLTQDEFDSRYRGSAVRRAGRDGFVRNVVVALGNSRAPEAVAALIRALEDRSPLVRSHAAWGLGRIGSPEAETALAAALACEGEPAVLEEISLALEKSGSPGARE